MSSQSLSLTYLSRRRLSYPFNPVPAHKVTACGICINTDEVLCSFTVIGAPQVDKLTTIIRKESFLCLVSFVINNRLYGLPSTDLTPTNQPIKK